MVYFTCNACSNIFKLSKFHAFWQAHFDTNTALPGTNSDCGGLVAVMDAGSPRR